MNSLLYIEPYVYIYCSSKQYIFYNELNNKTLECTDVRDQSLLVILDKLHKYYYAYLDNSLMEDVNIISFISKVRNYKIGDVVFSDTNLRHLAIKPDMFIRSSILNFEKDQHFTLGYKAYLLLHELSINTGYIPDKHSNGSTVFKHNSMNHKITVYNFFDNIISEISSFKQLAIINIVCYENSKYDIIFSFINQIKEKSKANINLILKYDHFKCFVKEIVNDITYKVFLNLSEDTNYDSIMDSYENIELYCELVDNYDIEKIDRIKKLYSKEIFLSVSTKNFKFLKDNVFMTKKDILSSKHSIHDILIKKILNQCFFGKIYIDEEGRMNNTSLGSVSLSIRDSKIIDAVYEELKQESSWFLTREKIEPCKNCLYNFLCPSISDIELNLLKFDLCKNIKKNEI